MRYVQSLPLPQGYRRGELVHDAVDELWFDDRDAYEAFRDSAAGAGLECARDELSDPASRITLEVDPRVMIDGEIPDDAVKNIEFVVRRADIAPEAFHTHWEVEHAPIARRMGNIRRYVQDHVRPDQYDGDRAPGYDGLAVTWFHSTAEMREGMGSEAYHELRADEPNFLDVPALTFIVTRESVVIP